MDRYKLTSGHVLAFFVLTTALNAHAQTAPPATTLGQVVAGAGGSSLQVATGEAVQRVCGSLLNNGNDGAGYANLIDANRPPISAEEDLFFRCNEMVHTANAISGTGGTSNTLGLTGAELARAMQQLAGEENASKGRLATETSNGQFANISLRLDAIARGARATTGGLATAGRSVGGLLGGNAGDETGEGAGWGWFANGAFGFGDREATSQEDEYEYDSNGFTFGADYQFPGGFVLGTAVGFADFEVDFEDFSQGTLAATQAGGGIETDGYSLSLFGLASPGRLTIDGVLIYGDNDYETARVVDYSPGSGATGRGATADIDRTILGSTDSTQMAAGFNVGTSFTWGATTLYLDGGLTYLDIEVDAYTEVDPFPAGGLNLSFDEQNIESLQSRLGLYVTRAFSRPSGVISPFFQVEWRHEHENDAELRRARYANALNPGDPAFDLVFMTDAPDQDFAEAGVGLLFVMRNRFQLVLDYRTSVSLNFADASLLSFSFRGAL